MRNIEDIVEYEKRGQKVEYVKMRKKKGIDRRTRRIMVYSIRRKVY